MTTQFDYLKKRMEHYEDTVYTEVQFPMVFQPGDRPVGFSLPGNNKAFWKALSRDGLTYIVYRLGTYVNRKQARAYIFNNEGVRRYSDFVRYVNQCRKWQTSENFKRRDEKLIVASQEGNIDGLMTHYNPFSHRDVVEMVEQSPIAQLMTAFALSPKELDMLFRSKFSVRGVYEFGMAIRNGETGHVTLGYHLYVRSRDYVFFIPLNVKRRHLSKIDEAQAGLEGILKTATDVEVDQLLKRTPAADILPLLSDKKFGILKQDSELFDSPTADDMVGRLFYLRGMRGYKVAASKALDVVFNKALTMINLGEN